GLPLLFVRRRHAHRLSGNTRDDDVVERVARDASFPPSPRRVSRRDVGCIAAEGPASPRRARGVSRGPDFSAHEPRRAEPGRARAPSAGLLLALMPGASRALLPRSLAREDVMKAIRAHGFGGPEVLHLDEIPRPDPGPGDVLVRVIASSVNPIDWKLRQGL